MIVIPCLVGQQWRLAPAINLGSLHKHPPTHMQIYTHTGKTYIYTYALHTHMKMENKKNEKK